MIEQLEKNSTTMSERHLFSCVPVQQPVELANDCDDSSRLITQGPRCIVLLIKTPAGGRNYTHPEDEAHGAFNKVRYDYQTISFCVRFVLWTFLLATLDCW